MDIGNNDSEFILQDEDLLYSVLSTGQQVTTFKTNEPLNNRVVILTEHRWKEHILIYHYEMKDFLLEIQDCVEAPIFITRNEEDPNRENFLKIINDGNSNVLIKTIVEFDYSDISNRGIIGNVITSFRTIDWSQFYLEGGIIYDATKRK